MRILSKRMFSTIKNITKNTPWCILHRGDLFYVLKERANTVRPYFLTNQGVRGSRFGPVSFAFQQPNGMFFILAHAASLSWHPAPPPINSLSGWGLGGAQPLAAAKARLYLAPSICLYTNNSIFAPLCESS